MVRTIQSGVKMSDFNYVLQKEGEEGRRIVHINMIKPYCEKENWVLYAIREGPEEKQELQCWEGRGEPQYNPEDVILSRTLSQSQKKEIGTLLQKYNAVFS